MNAQMKYSATIGFVGNPNCGKTTLFNAFSGANLKVANWPGVTVEKVEGSMRYKNDRFRLVDLPGTYSLTSYTMEEVVSRNFILSDEVDIIIDVVDASSLERNLYLTLQLLELGKPVVVALNMMDIVEKRGMGIDLHRLPEMLGVPVIPVSARKKRGLEVLIHAVHHHLNAKHPDAIIHGHDYTTAKYSKHRHEHHSEYAMVYSDEIEDKIDAVIDELKVRYPGEIQNHRWTALKLLEKDKEVTEKFPVDLPDVIDRSYEDDIINQKYDFIEEIIQEVVVNRDVKAAITDKVDAVLTDRIWGIPIFLGIMAIVFFLTFKVGNIFSDYFSLGIDWLGRSAGAWLTSAGASEAFTALITDGVIAGVGGILTFLPNIFILFLCLAFIEDSGYMARVAYVMDGLMGRLGLSGRAFIPLILGFGCTVPAIMASRTLENRRDRLRVMLITPFMSCSARLTIYILFSKMFFGDKAVLVAFSLYLIGFFVGLLVAFISHLLGRRHEDQQFLLIELPEYKAPSARTVMIFVWEKVKDYLQRAGGIIFVASVVMWFILNFGVHGYTTDISQSFGAIIGKAIVPFFRPLGLGYWEIAVAIIAGISAKEVVVSSVAVLYSVNNINAASGMAALSSILGASGFTALNAYSLMIFCLLYVPCAASLAVIKSESGSWKYTLFAACFQIAVAWVCSFLVFNIGSLFI